MLNIFLRLGPTTFLLFSLSCISFFFVSFFISCGKNILSEYKYPALSYNKVEMKVNFCLSALKRGPLVTFSNNITDLMCHRIPVTRKTKRSSYWKSIVVTESSVQVQQRINTVPPFVIVQACDVDWKMSPVFQLI